MTEMDCPTCGCPQWAWQDDNAGLQRLQAINADLLAALEWALPLAEICLEDTRQTRLQAGHDDIGREDKHPGLWPEEIAQRNAARAAITRAKGIKE